MSETNFSPDPGSVAPGAPSMSTPETLANIFFEPSATFDALRERPRFLVAALVLVALAMLVVVFIFQKVSFEQAIRQTIENSPRTADMTAEQKERVISMQTGPVGKALGYATPLIGTAIVLAAGAALYMLSASLMGGRLSYRQALSVWTYSSFPPAVVGTVLALVMLFLTPAEEIDFNRPGAGLLVTNLGALMSAQSSPVLRAALGWFDLFSFYGMFLAAVGLRRVGKLSSGSAWAIVIALWFVGMLVSVGRAALFGG